MTLEALPDGLCLSPHVPPASLLTCHGPEAWVPPTSLCTVPPPPTVRQELLPDDPEGAPAPLSCHLRALPFVCPPHSPTVSDELAYSLVMCSLSRPPDCEREGAVWIQSPCFPRQTIYVAFSLSIFLSSVNGCIDQFSISFSPALLFISLHLPNLACSSFSSSLRIKLFLRDLFFFFLNVGIYLYKLHLVLVCSVPIFLSILTLKSFLFNFHFDPLVAQGCDV